MVNKSWQEIFEGMMAAQEEYENDMARADYNRMKARFLEEIKDGSVVEIDEYEENGYRVTMGYRRRWLHYGRDYIEFGEKIENGVCDWYIDEYGNTEEYRGSYRLYDR